MTAGSFLFDRFGNPMDAPPAQTVDDTAKNLPNSVADVHVAPPADWEERLRAINPRSDVHSWLLFYWYRHRERWVLYDCVPRALINPKDILGLAFTGEDFYKAVDGPPPRELLSSQRHPCISDAQWEMHRVHRVYARPFWVLEGDTGGHQVTFSPEQKDYLNRVGATAEPPAIGSLPACSFDGRVIAQLARLNRLVQLNGIEQMRRTGTSESWDADAETREREIREVSLQLLEQQLGDLGEMVHALGGRKNTTDEVEHRTGQAARASEALAAYVETGQFLM